MIFDETNMLITPYERIIVYNGIIIAISNRQNFRLKNRLKRNGPTLQIAVLGRLRYNILTNLLIAGTILDYKRTTWM